MSLLFDTSPQEPERKKPKKRADEPAPPTPGPAVATLPAALVAPLGRLDEGVACLDTSCQAECHDILDEERGQWRLECCFCGTGQWIPVIRGHLPPPAEGADFVFRGGRFEGQTIAEASRSARGLDYIRWAASEHTQPAAKKACEIWLASMSAGR
jgi:hypothetical protein